MRSMESSFGDINRALLVGEVLHDMEQVAVDLYEPVKGFEFESFK